MTKKRVLIADDFLMSRQVFEKAIEEAEDLELAGSFPSAEEAVDFTRNKYADLVILDIVMTEGMNGLSAAKRIKDIRPETKVIMVTSMPEVSYMERAKETGVESFWYKEVQEQPIIDLIRRTLDGESIYPENAPVVNLGNALSTEFTERETQILRELVDGCSNKEIAKKFDISERTVKMHITSMIQKTGFRSRLELAVKARTGGLVIPDWLYRVFGKEPLQAISRAAQMAKITKGYPFAFQVLGHFTWKNDGDYNKALPQFKQYLEDYVYEKIWSEMSEGDRKLAYGAARSERGKAKEIKELSGFSDNEYSVYRDRLVKRGILDGTTHGYVEFTLPLFEEFVVYMSEK